LARFTGLIHRDQAFVEDLDAELFDRDANGGMGADEHSESTGNADVPVGISLFGVRADEDGGAPSLGSLNRPVS